MMHAIEVAGYGDASQLRYVERDEPVPGPGQVAIRVALTGVNFADIMARRGAYHAGSPPPFVPGLDCVGTISALGDGVADLKVGQRVAAFVDAGSYAQTVLARDVLTYPLHDRISDEAGASLLLLVTAYHTLTFAGKIKAGESVLVHAAAGGVGSTAVQIAKHLGAKPIIATAGSSAKLSIARGAGADVTIDYTKEDITAAVLRATENRGADVILDSVAGDVFAASVEAFAPFGRYVIYGMSSGKPGEAKTPIFHTQNRSLVGFSAGHYRNLRPAVLREGTMAVLELVAAGVVTPIIGARFPLRDAAQAQTLVESRASHGKVLLDPTA
jgi:NADPH2:quinone reductase